MSSPPPQLIPAGVLTTLPGPPTETPSGVALPTKWALTVVARSRATSQIGAVPMQSPSHRTNRNEVAAEAVSLRTVPRR